MTTAETNTKVGAFWDDALRFYDTVRTYHWWDFRSVRRYINEMVCGQRFIGRQAGLTFKLLQHCQARNAGYGSGISIGCGESRKELGLLLNGICERMQGCDLSAEAVRRARQFAADMGLETRYSVQLLDPVGMDMPAVDVVYWNMALHHMRDVFRACEWSHRMLRPGGLLIVFDYIGPTRFQFADDWQEPARQARLAMPEHWFANADGSQVLRGLNNYSLGYVTKDPSEAADSGRIMAAMRQHFPAADITLTGGLIYMHAMRGLWHNIDDQRDAQYIRLCLEMDRQQLLQGRSCYALAIWQKT